MDNNIASSIVESFEGWDECGIYGDAQLYDVVLAIDTKNFKKGDKINTVTFLLSESTCVFYNEDGTEVLETFKLKLIPVFE